MGVESLRGTGFLDEVVSGGLVRGMDWSRLRSNERAGRLTQLIRAARAKSNLYHFWAYHESGFLLQGIAWAPRPPASTLDTVLLKLPPQYLQSRNPDQRYGESINVRPCDVGLTRMATEPSKNFATLTMQEMSQCGLEDPRVLLI